MPNKLYLLATLILLFFSTSKAQEHSLKLIQKQKFDRVEKNLTEDLQKNPMGIEENFVGAVLFMSVNFEKFDIHRSYDHLIKSRNAFKVLSDIKEKEKLSKVPISDSIYQLNLDSLGRISLTFFKNKNTIADYEGFISYFVEIPTKYLKEAEKCIHIIAFSEAEKANTEVSFDAFIKKYPSSEQLKTAEKKRNALAFETAQSADDIKSYKEFLRKYPRAEQAAKAQERIEDLAFEVAKKINTSNAFSQYLSDFPSGKNYSKASVRLNELQYQEEIGDNDWSSYRNFIEKYPNNSFVSVAKDTILQRGLRNSDFFPLEYCVQKLGRAYYQKAIVAFYQLFSQTGSRSFIEYFSQNYDASGVQSQLEKELVLFEEVEYLDVESDEYIQKMAPRDPAYDGLIASIEEELSSKKWVAALNRVKSFQPYFKNDAHYLELVEVLSSNYDETIKVSKFGPTINSKEGDEYVPVISGDDNTLFYCAKNRNDNLGLEDIYYSEKVKGNWTQSLVLYDLSEEYTNDAPVSVSTDGNTLVLFKNGRLYFSDKNSYGWDEPVEYPESINSSTWQADGIYSSDGRAFFFSSAHTSGYGLSEGAEKGEIDIFVSVKDSDGNWSEPYNLGAIINTPFTDRSPFLHPDMKTLYFSSNGHGGLGGLDVFKSTRLADSCWTCWSKPIHMGKEINTTANDWGYKISTNGERAIFAKTYEGDGNGDICWLNLPNHLRPDFVATISGNLLDKDQKPVSATIRWEDLSTGKTVGESKTDPTDGGYFIVLPMGKIYGYYIDNNQYFPSSNNVDLRNQKVATEVDEDINLVTFKQMIAEGIAVPVNNLFFDVAKSEVLPYSIPELKRVAKIIIDHGLKVELSGHTDSDGDDAENMKLSDRRAAAVKTFLVGMGVPSEKIITIGHGETKPVMPNTTESGKAKNRRVEIRFVEQ